MPNNGTCPRSPSLFAALFPTHNYVSLTPACPTKNICHVHHSHNYAIIFPDLVTANFTPTIQITLNLTLLYTLFSRFFIPLKFTQTTFKHGSILDRSTRYFFSEPSRLALGPIQPPLRWVARVLPAVKRPEHKSGHSPQSSAEAKNEYECTFTPPTCLYGVQRDNLFGRTSYVQAGPVLSNTLQILPSLR
jgi:hypothetical protein